MEESEIFSALSDKNETYHLLKRKVSREINDQILELNLKGIGSRSETMRFYPEKIFSAMRSDFWDLRVRKGRGSTEWKGL